jgi:hypothetical protein
VPTCSEAHPARHLIGTAAIFPGVILLGREADRLLLSDKEVKNEWTYTYTPAYDFTKCAGTTLVYDVFFLKVFIVL